MKKPAARKLAGRGFTLVELAVVLIIVALLSGGMLITLSTSRDIALASETQKQLTGINDALLGFVAANGRLPCPASATSNGVESFCTGDVAAACGAELLTPAPDHGRCQNPFDGFLPGRTLGITPTDAQGYTVDPWNNRVRYGIASADDGTNFVFSGRDRIKAAWSAPPLPDTTRMLRICNTAAGAIADCQNLASTVADNAVAVVFSRGPNGGAAPLAADEVENGDNDRVFVSTTNSANFDDIVSWLSPNLVYNRMITAGRLP
jgi:prepilin-type N-terminal cleavage/methylation domain-containing protein